MKAYLGKKAMMNGETLLFGLVVLSFFAPLLVGLGIWRYWRMPDILKIAIAVISILFIAMTQYTWSQQSGDTEFLGWWLLYAIMFVPVAFASAFL